MNAAQSTSTTVKFALVTGLLNTIHPTTRTSGDVLVQPWCMVYSSNRKETGVASGRVHHCSMAGVRGVRASVKWGNGKTTDPCTKGMTENKDGNWSIG